MDGQNGRQMSRFEDRTATALLVVDMQRDVVAGGHDRDAVVETIAVWSIGRVRAGRQWCGCSTPTRNAHRF